MAEQEIHIVFDGEPGPEAPRFVEVETPDGRSIRLGDWRKRPDGMWALVFTAVLPGEDRSPGRHYLDDALVERDLSDAQWQEPRKS